MKRIGRVTATLTLLLVGTVLHAQDRGRRRGDEQTPKPAAVPAKEQQQRVAQEQQRASTYKTKLVQQVHVVQKQAATLSHARPTQARTQQEYAAQLQQQQRRLPGQRDFTKDPYVSAPVKYRYVVDGTVRQTNDYGAQVLRQAVNNGYEQGYRAGQADRADHWKSSYQTSPAYKDANYGFEGNYVAQADYNYYFRQGFRRGYQDGYAARFQYGTNSNGTASILGSVLTGILGLKSIG